MNAPSIFARLSIAALAASLCSCVYTNTDPGYGSYGSSRVSSGYGYGPGYGYGNYGLPWGIGGGAYRSGYGYCDICHSNPCRCGRRGTQYYRDDHDHGHYDHDRDHHRDDSKHREDAYRIAGGSVGGSKTKPTGYHSPEWYKSKGYDTSRLRLENEDGEVYRSSSSSRSSSSHSSRDRDDDRRSSSSSSRSSSSGSSHHKSDDRNHDNPRFEQRSGGGGGSSSSRSGGGDGDSRKRH